MFVTVEISYYPLDKNFDTPISEFLKRLQENPNLSLKTGTMSSLLTGEYSEIMKALTESMHFMMDQTASVFNIKISNACQV